MVTAIFPAAGQGKRMQAGMNKVFVSLAGTPIFIRTLLKFSKCDAIDKLVIVVAPGEEDFIRTVINRFSSIKPFKIVVGGEERQYSVRNGLAAIDPETDVVLVHDAARPMVSEETIYKTISAARKYGGAVAAVPAKNTIKICDEELMVKATPDRSTLWEIQTPQGFKTDILVEAHERAFQDNFLGTDEASLVERIGGAVKIVESDYRNIKITTPEDMLIAEAFLREETTSKAFEKVQGIFDGVTEELKNRFSQKRG